jgi:hypothetical protein
VADGAVRNDGAVRAVLIVLHGVGSTSERRDWPSESRGALELLIAGLAAV